MTKKRTYLRPSHSKGSPPSPVLPVSGSTNAGRVKNTVSNPTEGKDLHIIQISSAPRPSSVDV